MGNDVFVLANTDSGAFTSGTATTASWDVITDFNVTVDKIQTTLGTVSVIYTGGSQSTYAPAQTDANSYFAGHTGTDVVAEQVGSDTNVFFDLTNTNLASMVVQLTGVTASTLILADFI